MSTGKKQTTVSGPDFRLLFESIPGSFVVVQPNDPTFTIVAASDAFLRGVQEPRETLLGKGLFEVLGMAPSSSGTGSLQELWESLRLVVSTGRPDCMPMRADGSSLSESSATGHQLRYFSRVNSPVLNERGEIQCIIHRVEDVTDYDRLRWMEAETGKLELRPDELQAELVLRRRQLAKLRRVIEDRERLEKKLRESETQFGRAFAEAPIGMVLTSPEGHILDANAAFLELVGYSLEELLSSISDHFTHPDDIELTRKFIASLREGSRASGTLEKRYVRKDGKHIWARVSATMYRDAEGKPAQLIAIIEDITARRRAEERLRAIYDGTYEYIGLLAPDGTLLEANRASLEFAGNTREDVVGRKFWDTPWFTPTPGAPQFVREGVMRAARGEFVRYEATLYRPSGEVTTFDISLHPIRDDRGDVVLIVPEARDITQRTAFQLRDAFLVRLDDATRALVDPQQITQTAAQLLSEYLILSRCAYAAVGGDQNTFNITGDYNRGAPTLEGLYTFSQFGSDLLQSMREGRTFFVEDTETDPRTETTREAHHSVGVRSFIWVPLLKAGRCVAAMAALQAAPRIWQPAEIELVRQVANRCWESIERAHVSRELQASESRLRLAQKVGGIGSFEWLIKEGRIIWTPELETLYGLDEGAFQGTLEHWAQLVVPEDVQNFIANLQDCISGRLSECACELRAAMPGGGIRWLQSHAHLIRDEVGSPVRVLGVNIDIHARKQAEAYLHQQWHTFDTALSNTPDQTYIVDLQGRYTYANRALLSLWQKSYDEVIGKSFPDLGFTEQLSERLTSQLRQVISTKRAVRDQAPCTVPSGDVRHYEYILVPVFDAQGNVQAVAGSSRDFTEQNLASRQIEEDRARWRDLLVQTPAAIAVLRGPDYRFEWVNDDYSRLLGRPPEAIVGKPLLSAFPEVADQGWVPLLESVYRSGQPYFGHESPLRVSSAERGLKQVYLNFVYAPIRNLTGEVDGIFVHATDVTDMVIARKQVEENERQFRTLAETIPHLAWTAYADGSIFWYNRRWYEYTGTVPEEVEGWGWQKVHRPDMLPEVLKRWTQSIETGEPFEMVFPIKGANGEFRSFLTRVEPVRDNQGSVVRWFGTNTDITAQRETEDELRRMNRELEEFAYVASHDLQEPLRMVNIYTQLILRNVGETNETLHQYAGFVRQGVHRMAALISDLLTFSRTVHSETLPSGRAELSVSLNEAVAILKDRIEESGASITFEAMPAARGDTTQMAHVFQNLLSNSLKYRRRGVRPEIQVSARHDRGQCIVAISDNGIGFEPQYAERIFGLFKRLHKDDQPGTGIGLAICKRIVERSGGRIWGEGRPGEGSTFYFSLPAVNDC